MGKEKDEDMNEKKKGSLWSIFKHADWVDKLVMCFGLLGSIGDGLVLPINMVVTSGIMNHIGAATTTVTTTSLSQAFTHQINKNAMILCILAAGQWFACFLEGYCWTRTADRQASTLRLRYLKAVLRQDVGYFDLHVSSTAEVISNISTDSLVIQDVIGEKVPNLLMNLSLFLSCYIAAFVLGWRLAIVGFPFIILLIIPGLMYGRALITIARKAKSEYGKAGIIVEQAISSIRTVYSFVGEKKTSENYSNALDETMKLGMKLGLAKGFAIGSNCVIFIIWAFVSYYGSRLVMYHGYLGGTLFAVGVCLILGGLALGSGLSTFKYLFEAAAAAERVMEVIEKVPTIDLEDLQGHVLDKVKGEIEFNKIEFSYPSRPESIIFKGFDLKIPSGKAVALVGGSGSGKSTVIALLQRFYDPISGEILLDGVSIDKLQLKWLRSQLGLVCQEPALFATSIKENILFGKEDASLEDVMEAAKASNAHNFISELPQGYDTQVGERGVQMSGGQKQRIAIARAIIKAPKILLLDEATSALDAESERIVQDALDKAALGRTTIIIAHRLSTIKQADIITVVQNGMAMESGSHDELMANENSLYTSLVRLQQTKSVEESANSTTPSRVSNARSDICNVSSRRMSAVSRPSYAESSVLCYGMDNAVFTFEKHAFTLPTRVSNARSDGYNISSRRMSAVSRVSSAESSALSYGMDNVVFSYEKNAFPLPSFKRLLAMNIPEWRQAIIACLSAVTYGAVQPIYSYTLGTMLSVYFLTDHKEIKDKITMYSLIFLGLAIVGFIVNIGQHYYFAYMGEHLTKRIREKMFSKILTFEIGWFDQDENATGAIYSRLEKDANMVRSLVGDRMSLLIQAISGITIAAIFGLVIAWRLALVMIASQPMIILSYYCKSLLLKRLSEKSMKAQAESSKIAAEAVSNLRTITAFGSQSRILQMLKQAQAGTQIENVRQSWFAGVGLGTSQSLNTLIVALTFWYGGKLISENRIGPKALFETFFILMSTGRVIAEAGTMTNDIAKGADSVGSVFDILDRNSSISPEDQDGRKPLKLTGHIEFRNVDFAYPARLDVSIFHGFDMKIEAGKSTALVGQSGSGKSTIICLIERFYDPLRGVVRIDGKDIKKYNLRSLRKHIAMVSQEPMLFADTISENITYGCSGVIDESEIIEAAKAANAHDFISGLKDGYATWCGDRGVQLSGGQKQRIAIARAILKNPAILLLDEATSALDSRSEKAVQDALERVMIGRTSVVVAHRLSSIQNCDMIAVLDKGKVIEKGTHSDLISKGPIGAYYSLVNLHQTYDSANQ